jgi:hypothetical protein
MNYNKAHFLKSVVQELTCLVDVTRECQTDFTAFHRNRPTPRLSGIVVCHITKILSDNISNSNAFFMFNNSSQCIISARSCYTVYQSVMVSLLHGVIALLKTVYDFAMCGMIFWRSFVYVASSILKWLCQSPISNLSLLSMFMWERKFHFNNQVFIHFNLVSCLLPIFFLQTMEWATYNISSDIFSTTEEEWAENGQKDWMVCGLSQCSVLASDLSLHMQIIQQNWVCVAALRKKSVACHATYIYIYVICAAVSV